MIQMLKQFRWGSAQAGVSLSLASSAWLLSGLTDSPLLNSLLPALTTLPALLYLQRRAVGFVLELSSIILLAILCSPFANNLSPSLRIVSVLIAGLVIALGQDLSQLPIQRELLNNTGLSFKQLRQGTELGALAGFGLTGLIKPGWHQFIPAALFLLPLLPTVIVAGATTLSKIPVPKFNARASLQGLIFGGFFALLPLWVRSISTGNCFNFGVVLVAYGIGRSLINTTPNQPSWRLYSLIALLLLAGSWLPGWVTTAFFLPIGILAAGTDRMIVDQISPNDPATGWQILQRSGAIGGLFGVLIMGIVAQLIGLPSTLLIQLILFLAAPLLLKSAPWASAL